MISYSPDRDGPGGNTNTWTCDVKVISIAYSIRIGVVSTPPGEVTVGRHGDSWKNHTFCKSAFYLETVSHLVYNGASSELKQGSRSHPQKAQTKQGAKMFVQPNDTVRVKVTMIAAARGIVAFEILRERVVGEGLEIVHRCEMRDLFSTRFGTKAWGEPSPSASGLPFPFNDGYSMQFNIQFCKRGDEVEAIPLIPLDLSESATDHVAAAASAGAAAAGAGADGADANDAVGPVQRHQSNFVDDRTRRIAADKVTPILDPSTVTEYPQGASKQLNHLARIGQVVPFIGAGISQHSLPLWIPLLKQVWTRATNPPAADADVMYVFSVPRDSCFVGLQLFCLG